MATLQKWAQAQQWESNWWRQKGFGCLNSYHEEFKQHIYAEHMGIKFDEWDMIDLAGKSVLDVGGGPVSLLLKCINGRRMRVVDPLDFPDWVKGRYEAAGIELAGIPAEEMDESGWDEVWIYNTLQHVQDPRRVIAKARRAGKLIRVFEYLGRPANEGHPHDLTAGMLDEAFGRRGAVTQLAGSSVGGQVYYGVFDYAKPDSPTAPLELHWVNTGASFPYAYYLAIMSALKTQKAAKFNLWLARQPSGPYFDAIRDKVTLRHFDEGVPEFPSLHDKDENFRNAHLVDYYRWRLLLDHGGVLTDLDSLSLSDYCAYIAEQLSAPGKDFLASLAAQERLPRPYHNSLFAGKKGSPLVEQMLALCCHRLFHPDGFQWGDTGPHVLNELCVANPDKVVEAPYGLLGGCVELYQLYKPDGVLPDNIRFVHLWANSSGAFWTGINEEYIEQSDHLYAKLVRGLLTREERHPVRTPDIASWLSTRGQHYKPMWDYLKTHRCRNIMEIGACTGENALLMIKTAASQAPEREICYYGFDLFEDYTPQLQAKEFFPSCAPPPLADVEQYLAARTTAQIHLYRGRTEVTLPQEVGRLPPMDFIYIDGGHSIETIRNDWAHASKLVGPSTVVFFDDYFDEMPFIGCRFLLQELTEQYESQVMPESDTYPAAWGRLKSQLLAVRPKPKVPTPLLPTSKLVLHVLGLAHTKTTKDFMACAYTQKVLKMCQMMKARGYEVIHYGAEGSSPDCTEHVDVVSDAVQRRVYNYDWKKENFRHDPKDEAYQTFNRHAISAINARKGSRDLLLISMGNYQKPIADAVGLMAVEMGVGYTGVFTSYRVFESYAWMHYIYGMMYPDNGGCDGRFYDAVIPNYYDPADFEFSDKKDDYYLYIGRLIPRKGVHIAAQCCQEIGARMIIAGQGTDADLRTLGVDPAKVEFVGYVDAKRRSDLMSRAKAVFVPTLYLEPFGGVNVEAMFCGTPAITTDWGGFTETVRHGETGYSCRTMEQFAWAARNVDTIDARHIRDYAIQNYSVQRVSLMYDEYFHMLQDL
ncbi:MAG: glycosyltransferase, partial [Chloroflexota bacterium]|nr:glycosyltransferase [Chloroflexota bacterium]